MTDIIKKEGPDYIERADAARNKTTKKMLLAGAMEFDEGAELVKNGSRDIFNGILKIRAAGEKFIAAHDGRQLSFSDYGLAWYRRIEDWLPEKFTMQKIACAVAVLKALPEKPKTMDECRPAIQIALIGAEVISAPGRGEAKQIAHESNRYTQFISSILNIQNQFEKLEEENPLTKWSAAQLQQVVRNGRPLADVVRRAEELLSMET